MEFTRVILISALFLVAALLWEAWGNEHRPPSAPPSAASSIPTIATPVQSAQPGVPPVKTASTPAISTSTTQQLITVKTDVFSVAIDPKGGNIVRTTLLKYGQNPSEEAEQQPYQLLSDAPANFYVAQSGLLSNEGPDTQQGQAIYTADQKDYTLAPDQKQLIVDLKWQSQNGLAVHKQFIFQRDDYQINVNYNVENNTNMPWSGQFYAQLQRKKPVTSHSFFGISSYTGAAVSSAEKPYQKISFDKMSEQNFNKQIQGGWAAMQEHYFLSAWVPNAKETFNYYGHDGQGGVYTIGLLGPTLTVAPKEKASTNAKLYVGPESVDRLETVAPNLNLTIDYGILWFISSALFWLMKQIYNIVGNWGWSIVLVTILVKLAFYHLSAKSYHSMAAMRRLQPRMQAIKERYGDDRQKATQATMELYKNEKINPLGGCLPIIVQIPVFIALYYVLLESVELRHSPFILWIHDLSTKDPYFILPILMGLTMFIQQRLNPPPPDPTQAKMMQLLPIFFTFLFISFPAGLVLYWVVNNALSILQQWYIMRRAEIVETRKKKS